MKIPKKISSQVPIKKLLQVESWWEKLDSENQEELINLYRKDKISEQNTVSIFLCGKFVEQEESHKNDMFWIDYFYDYLINHEIFLIDNQRTYYICSNTKEAEISLRKGFIHKNFICPIQSKECLMQKILKQGLDKSLRIYVKFRLD